MSGVGAAAAGDGAAGFAIRVVLPGHLRTLAAVPEREVTVTAGSADVSGVLDALEARFPQLRGTIRDQRTGKRRPFVRFYACELDLSHEPADALLPAAVLAGTEPLLIIGAMAGG